MNLEEHLTSADYSQLILLRDTVKKVLAVFDTPETQELVTAVLMHAMAAVVMSCDTDREDMVREIAADLITVVEKLETVREQTFATARMTMQ